MTSLPTPANPDSHNPHHAKTMDNGMLADIQQAQHQRTSSSRSRSPRAYTEDLAPTIKIKKRIIICCDGTWKDGLVTKKRWKFTNVLRIARGINSTDYRTHPPTPQVMFYQSGVGTDDSLQSRLIAGATGLSLADKVQEAYAFIAHNYESGDEISLFGFSRGAYTARMVAQFIGHIGVLHRQDMDHFAQIFIDFQKRGKMNDPKEIAELDKKLEPWTNPRSRGKVRMQCGPDSFPVKIIGVFDTVGALGLPEELTFGSSTMVKIFGFNDRRLGSYVERAYHAMALNEERSDFKVCKFEQTKEGKEKGQVLKQCWFAGSHSDVGGGYEDHDLSDITLTWMAAHVGDAISVDLKYLASRPDPIAPYGQQPPNSSKTGVFTLARSEQREIPRAVNDVTCETIHPSVLNQLNIQPPELAEIARTNPELVHKLLPLEDEVRRIWPFDLAKATERKRERAASNASSSSTSSSEEDGTVVDEEHPKDAVENSTTQDVKSGGFVGAAKGTAKEVLDKLKEKMNGANTERVVAEGGRPTEGNEQYYGDAWLSRVSTNTSLGPFADELRGR